jgi:hypothetical protein
VVLAAFGGIVAIILVSRVCVIGDGPVATPGCYKPFFWGDVPGWQGYILWFVSGAIAGWLVARIGLATTAGIGRMVRSTNEQHEH